MAEFLIRSNQYAYTLIELSFKYIIIYNVSSDQIASTFCNHARLFSNSDVLYKVEITMLKQYSYL